MLLLAALLLAGCSSPAADPSAVPTPTETGMQLPDPILVAIGVPFDQALHDELVAMLERDQAGRLGGVDDEGDQARTERLAEVLDEHGWPSYDLVGEDGEDAAWAIAQHSDFDVEFQQRALAYLIAAEEVDQASPGNVAYLTDRVAANLGEPQVYGTQVGCDDEGKPALAPIEDEATLDQRRADLGLPSMSDYLAEMAAICQESVG
jgi:hypothetical protein